MQQRSICVFAYLTLVFLRKNSDKDFVWFFLFLIGFFSLLSVSAFPVLFLDVDSFELHLA